MAGVEVAGLVLATLPLFVEAAKAYARGAETLRGIVLHSRRDERLGEFYDEFYFNVIEVEQHVRTISEAATAGISQPSSILDLDQWAENTEIANCLERVFKNEADYERYLVITRKIAKLLASLLENESLHINRADMGAVLQ